MLLFSNLIKLLFGYFDPEKIFIDNEITRVDLTDISAKKEALLIMHVHTFGVT